MAIAVGRFHEYEIFYGHYSNVMHGSSHSDQIKISQGRLSFSPIRSLRNISEVLRLTIALVLGIYQKTLKYYRPDELPAHGHKYIEDWRTPFMEMKDVHYVVTEE